MQYTEIEFDKEKAKTARSNESYVRFLGKLFDRHDGAQLGLPKKLFRGGVGTYPNTAGLLSLLNDFGIEYELTYENTAINVDRGRLRDLYRQLAGSTALKFCEPILSVHKHIIQSWVDTYGFTLSGPCLIFENDEAELIFARDFAANVGLPHTICMIQKEFNGDFKITMDVAVPLFDIFKNIVAQNSHDIERALDITWWLKEAYLELVGTDRRFDECEDFTLVTLFNYQELDHFAGGSELDMTLPLPRYWFESRDFPSPDQTAPRYTLALSEANGGKLTHIVRCGFPAGAMFLQCRLPRGTTEYLYLRNVNERVYMISSTQI